MIGASISKSLEFDYRSGQELSFCDSRFLSLQLDEANANGINNDIHLHVANTLF